MRKSVLASAVITAAVVAGATLAATASQAAVPRAATSKTLVFHVVFSPHEFIMANNVRPKHSPVALGDGVVFNDQLFSNGRHVGQTAGSCVIVALTPQILNNCSAVFEVPGGTITAQFATFPGGVPKPIALTGGGGAYRNAGGDGTLVEFGNGKGSLTLHVLSLVPRGGDG
jgi:allene oxide cyclase-like protein